MNQFIEENKSITNIPNTIITFITLVECAILLIIIVFPELHHIILFGVNIHNEFHNPFYQRAWASAILSINFFYLYYCIQLSKKKKFLYQHLLFLITCIKSLYYLILLFCGFILLFLETVITNSYSSNNIPHTTIIILSILAVLINFIILVIHFAVVINVYNKNTTD